MPDFTGTDPYFFTITLNGRILDEKMLLLLRKIGDERLEEFSTADFLAIDALFFEKPLNTSIRSRLKHLKTMGVVEIIGGKKYVLARGLYGATGKAGVHTRLVGLDRETNKELLLKHLRESGAEDAPFREFQQVLPAHSRKQIQVLLSELKKEDRVYFKGNTKAARWFLTSIVEKK